MASIDGTVVVLGTGGTMAGTAADAADNVGYSAAQLGVQALVAAVPPLARLPIECEQVAQVDSKDMSHALWLTPGAARVASPGAPRGRLASSSPMAPTRWRKRPTSCIACSRRPSRWC